MIITFIDSKAHYSLLQDELNSAILNVCKKTNFTIQFLFIYKKAYRFIGQKKSDLLISEKYAKMILSLPMYPELTEKQINYVVSTLKSFID